MNRRQFLVRAASAVGALITTTFVRQSLAYIETHAAPLLLEPAQRARRVLYAVPRHAGYGLYLGEPDEQAPVWTWQELAEEQGCYGQREILEFVHGHAAPESVFELRGLLNQPADDWTVGEYWASKHAPNTLAFHYLDELDLGPDFGARRGARGELRFIEGCCPGNDLLMVEAGDALTLSLLQARLNELDERTEIRVWPH